MGDKLRSPSTLRFMTYLSPDVPIALFEMIRDYLEEKTGIKAYLITESRWTGPPDDRTDPLTADEADIVFWSSTTYLDQKTKQNKFMELCKAAPVHVNNRAADDPVCFSDVVVLSSKVEQQIFKDFEALRGSRWAYTQKKSITGSIAMLSELKKRGYNANFFGSTYESGSHLNSVGMLLNGQVDVASINSVVLASYRIDRPELAQQLHVIKSLGPLPMYSIVFNVRLPSELKETITQALLDLTKDMSNKGVERFMTRGVKGFAHVSEDSFSLEKDIVDSVKEMSTVPAYY